MIEFLDVLTGPILGIALTLGLDLIRLYNVCLKKFFVHSGFCLFCFRKPHIKKALELSGVVAGGPDGAVAL